MPAVGTCCGLVLLRAETVSVKRPTDDADAGTVFTEGSGAETSMEFSGYFLRDAVLFQHI